MYNISKEACVNLSSIIENSPMMDCNGNKFILLSQQFVRCFYKNFFNTTNDSVKEVTLTVMSSIIARDARYCAHQIGFRRFDPIFEELKSVINKVYPNVGTLSMYILHERAVNKEFNLNSAISNLIKLIKENPTNKYLLPMTDYARVVDTEQPSKPGGYLNDYVRVFQFHDNFENDLKTLKLLVGIDVSEIKIPTFDEEETNNQEPAIVSSSTIDHWTEKLEDSVKSEEKPKAKNESVSQKIDKFEKKAWDYYDEMQKAEKRGKESITDEEILSRLNDIITNCDSVKVWKELINLADRILEKSDEVGIKTSSLSKYFGKKKPVLMVNDNCGYPVVNSIDDIPPTPFPEDKVQGDQVLANL